MSNLAAAGVWPAVPLTGYLLFARPLRVWRSASLPAAPWFALMTVAGLAVWSVPLLGTAVAGVYRPAYLGLIGWSVTLIGLVAVVASRVRRQKPDEAMHHPLGGPPANEPTDCRSPAVREKVSLLTAWDWVLVSGLVLAAALYLGFPTESIYGGRDEGVYANHAIYMARHGRLDVPYPWPADAAGIFAAVWDGFPGFYKTPGTMTVQFGHLFPVWLAQAFATAGHHGLFRLNAFFAMLSLAVFYGLCRIAVPKPYAVIATLFLAFNPSQLWMARITLSEVFTQLFTWSGLALLLHALRDRRPALARWTGVFLGFSAFVRFDSLFLLPMVLLAHLALRLTDEPRAEAWRIWGAFYQTAVPLFGLACGYFAVFSAPYFADRPYLRVLSVASIASAVLLLLSTLGIAKRVGAWVAQQAFLVPAGVGLLALAAWAYWIRPLPTAPPRMAYQWPGFYIDLTKGNYRADALVNLAQYLSPAVVWAAIAGWYASLWTVVRSKRDVHLLVPLVITAGFAVAYLYDHFNTPDHFWWIRRFVPVVIPGFVLCATLGVRGLLAALPRPWSSAAGAAIVLFLSAFTLQADKLILTFAEDSGYFAQLEELAQRLPPGEPIVTHGHKTWVAPLYVSFDRQVIPVDLTTAGGQEAWKAWASRQASHRRLAYLLTEVGSESSAPGTEATLLTRSISAPVVSPLPQKVLTLQTKVKLYTVTDPGAIVLPPPVTGNLRR